MINGVRKQQAGIFILFGDCHPVVAVMETVAIRIFQDMSRRISNLIEYGQANYQH